MLTLMGMRSIYIYPKTTLLGQRAMKLSMLMSNTLCPLTANQSEVSSRYHYLQAVAL